MIAQLDWQALPDHALRASFADRYPASLTKIMNIQEFLTYFINTFVLSSIIFFLLDFYFYLFNSWQQLNSSTQPSFYQQVKDIFQDAPPSIISGT